MIAVSDTILVVRCPEVNLYHGYHKRITVSYPENAIVTWLLHRPAKTVRPEVSFKEEWFSSVDNFYLSSITEQDSTGYRLRRLETMDLVTLDGCDTRMVGVVHAYLDSLCVKLEAILCDQELLNIFALITFQLNHIAHLTI